MFSISSVGGLAGSAAGVPGGGEGGGPPAPIIDPFWENVVLYTRLDADTPIDLSISAHTLTPGSGAALDVSEKVFGDGSFDMDNTVNGKVTAADHADWHFGDQPFTVECWTRWTSLVSHDSLVSQWLSTGNERGWLFFLVDSGPDFIRFVYSEDGTGETNLDTDGFIPELDRWYHIVAQRDENNDFRMFIDGEIRHRSNIGTANFNDAAAELRIGTDDEESFPHDGHFDEVRITKGVARYGV